MSVLHLIFFAGQAVVSSVGNSESLFPTVAPERPEYLSKELKPGEVEQWNRLREHYWRLVDGIMFDSMKKAEFYCELKLLTQAGEVVNFELQPDFVLQEGFNHNCKKVWTIIYRDDFRIHCRDGRAQIVDVKGAKTKEYLLKKKMLLAKYPGIEFEEA